jgi:hypothetical protein
MNSKEIIAKLQNQGVSLIGRRSNGSGDTSLYNPPGDTGDGDTSTKNLENLGLPSPSPVSPHPKEGLVSQANGPAKTVFADPPVKTEGMV